MAHLFLMCDGVLFEFEGLSEPLLSYPPVCVEFAAFYLH
jgi:hypothetical protein